MESILMTVVMLSVLATTTLAKSEWNQETRDLVLKIHNDLRREESGCLINKLVYDMELERQAKQWAEGCVLKNEKKEGRGENLDWSPNQKPESELIYESSYKWFNEKKVYSYGQYSCAYSCHYTQMVWGNTSKIGCYSYTCPILVGAYATAWYLVCFYTPIGNWNGVKPYDKTCKSTCADGQAVDNGLCVGKSDTSEGEDGGCKDDNIECADWAKYEECQNNPDYMLEYCKKSCEVCVSNTSCENSNTDCAYWAKIGECNKNPSYMEINCRKSCKICVSNTSCENSNTDCAYWAKIGECNKNPSYMEINCRKSCKICVSNTSCEDSNNDCAYWAKIGECKYNPGYMVKTCKKACHIC